MGLGLTVGAAPGYKVPIKRLQSYTLRWWTLVQVPYIHHGHGPFTDTEIRYNQCWAQVILQAITEDEAQMVRLLMGPEGRGEPNNWLIQRLMGGVSGAVYGIHLQPDTPAQAEERKPLRTFTRDPTTAELRYTGAVGTHLPPGVHPADMGI